MEKLFLNFTNHPSEKWDSSQIKEAVKYGKIVDMPFPAVEPVLDKEGIQKIAEEYVEKICEMHPAAVLCQGEFSLTYQIVRMLQEEGVLVFAACSKRRVVEQDGKKIVEFVFEKFREY